MSVLMAVRIPDELATQVDAKGKRSAVIIAALRSYLGETPQPKLKARPGVTRESVTVPPVVVRETVLSYQRPTHAPGCRCLMCSGGRGK